MPGHLVQAALPLLGVPVVGVVQRPDVALHAAEEEVGERGAAAVVDEHERRLLAAGRILQLERVGTSGEHGGRLLAIVDAEDDGQREGGREKERKCDRGKVKKILLCDNLG